MIVFDLECRSFGHRFEGWFGSTDDFSTQQKRGLLTCPLCACEIISKAPMAPNLARKGNQLTVRPAEKTVETIEETPAVPVVQPAMTPPPSLPPEAIAALAKIATFQAEALKQSQWVGAKFADKARAIHYGEAEPAQIHGEATAKQAQDLLEEGIEIAPILFPMVPPSEAN
jgi:hypothetical protein